MASWYVFSINGFIGLVLVSYIYIYVKVQVLYCLDEGVSSL